jgi:hypothetical protein
MIDGALVLPDVSVGMIGQHDARSTMDAGMGPVFAFCVIGEKAADMVLNGVA